MLPDGRVNALSGLQNKTPEFKTFEGSLAIRRLRFDRSAKLLFMAFFAGAHAQRRRCNDGQLLQRRLIVFVQPASADNIPRYARRFPASRRGQSVGGLPSQLRLQCRRAKLDDFILQIRYRRHYWLSDSSSEDMSNVMSFCAAIRDLISRTRPWKHPVRARRHHFNLAILIKPAQTLLWFYAD